MLDETGMCEQELSDRAYAGTDFQHTLGLCLEQKAREIGQCKLGGNVLGTGKFNELPINCRREFPILSGRRLP